MNFKLRQNQSMLVRMISAGIDQGRGVEMTGGMKEEDFWGEANSELGIKFCYLN